MWDRDMISLLLLLFLVVTELLEDMLTQACPPVGHTNMPSWRKKTYAQNSLQFLWKQDANKKRFKGEKKKI